MSADGFEVLVNGQPRRAAAGSTVGDLLAELGRHPRMVAVEHNGAILPRDRYDATPLAAGDRLEIVGFVQGG
jgi:thiamine biosynthesis protein ThiS